ncbi:helix-turn-helix domain-containing protein [Candidatus Dojkabacteria bacterium]|nr:helix-turn-helix domain-containing protein [Candidatus Dojkabacteria bacterium]
MGIKIAREDTKDCKVTVVEPVEPHEPTIYDLAFLHIELRWIREYNLTDLELLIFAFINSYKPRTGKIYFSNAQLGKMFNRSEKTITRIISSLKVKGLIEVELQTGIYGGTIRYLVPRIQENSDYSKMSTPLLKNEYPPAQKCPPNSNRNSNKNIPKGMEDNPPEYGNSDISKLQKALKERYPIPLAGVTDRRKIHNLIQVLNKRKNQDEWMNDDWKQNLADFMNMYLNSAEQKYLVRSVSSLREKIKLWREYEGKLN